MSNVDNDQEATLEPGHWTERAPANLVELFLSADDVIYWIHEATICVEAIDKHRDAEESETSEYYSHRQRELVVDFACTVAEVRNATIRTEQRLRPVEEEFGAVAEGVIEEWEAVAASMHEWVAQCGTIVFENILRASRESWDLRELAATFGEDYSFSPEMLLEEFDEARLKEMLEQVRWYNGDKLQRYGYHLKQELFRVWKRFYPPGEDTKTLADLPEEEQRAIRELVGRMKNPRSKKHVLTAVQVSIMKALDGRALKKEQLAAECKIDPSRLYKPGGIKELMDLEKVDNKRGVGYFRLDAPPPNAVDLE